MRTKLIIGAVALLFATPAFAEAWDFVLTNSTGKPIKAIEISPAGAATWQANIVDAELKKDALVANGARTTVHFDKGGGQCRFDLKLTFGDDSSATWTNINVCDNAYVTLRYKDGAPVFAAS